MSIKTQLINSLQTEVDILKHLHAKITPEQLSYRPQEGMRSTEELLEYLKNCLLGYTYYFTTKEQDGEAQKAQFTKFKEEAKAATDFPAALDSQLDQVKAMLADVSEEDMLNSKVKHFLGHETTLGDALMNGTFKYLSAYRMQLFLYLKMSGNASLNTYNNWMAMDAPVKAN